MTLRRSASGIVASATMRLPRVRRTLIWEAFLSVAKLDSRKWCSIPGYWDWIHRHASWVALPVRFWPAASPWCS
jgi:hypothetical protein